MNFKENVKVIRKINVQSKANSFDNLIFSLNNADNILKIIEYLNKEVEKHGI